MVRPATSRIDTQILEGAGFDVGKRVRENRMGEIPEKNEFEHSGRGKRLAPG
jgi:hypothetical protein